MQKWALYCVLAEQVAFNQTKAIKRLFVSFPLKKKGTPQLAWASFTPAGCSVLLLASHN